MGHAAPVRDLRLYGSGIGHFAETRVLGKCVAVSSANMSKDSDSIGAIGDALVEALGSQRTQSVSLHEPDAEILWLSEGVMGPDEHNLVLEASNALAIVADRAHIFQIIGDGRSALFLPARTPLGELVGLATILTESKWLDASGAAKLVNTHTTAAMRRLAILRKPAAPVRPVAPPAASTKAPAKANDAFELTLEDSPPAPAAAKAAPLPPAKSGNTGRVAALRSVSSPAATKYAPATNKAAAKPSNVRSSADGSRATPPASKPAASIKPIEFEGAGYELHVQQLLKLRSGGGTRRYEVLARRVGASDKVAPTSIADTVRKKLGTSQFDRLVVEYLIKWLASNPSIWDTEPASFSVNLSMSSIEDPKFLAFVASQLKTQQIPAATLGFELTEHACVQQRKDVDLFVAGCEKLGCFIAIDDFTLHSSAVPWLASRAVRFVKIDPRITQSAMTEKLSQAMVVAMSQASKVLGISCVAKRIDTPAARQWLQAVGVDYAQGFLLEQPRTLASLLAAEGSASN